MTKVSAYTYIIKVRITYLNEWCLYLCVQCSHLSYTSIHCGCISNNFHEFWDLHKVWLTWICLCLCLCDYDDVPVSVHFFLFQVHFQHESLFNIYFILVWCHRYCQHRSRRRCDKHIKNLFNVIVVNRSASHHPWNQLHHFQHSTYTFKQICVK